MEKLSKMGRVMEPDKKVTYVVFSVNEVNYTMEFRNSIQTTGVNIPAKVVDFTLSVDV